MSAEIWLCLVCKLILGHVENKKYIRIKRRDLCVEVERGKVTIVCPRCGKPNTVEDDGEIKDAVSDDEGLVDIKS